MSSTPIDFSKYATKPASGQIDFGKYAKQDLGSMADENGVSAPAAAPSSNFLSDLGSSLWSDIKSAIPHSLPTWDIARTGAQEFPEKDAARKQAGYSTAYRIAAPIGESVGVNATGMENDAAAGKPGGVIGHAVALPALAAATYGVGKGIGAAYGKIAPVAGDIASTTVPHEELANALKPSTHIDVVGDAQRALPALKESAADLGQAPKTPQQLKATINRAVDIHEAKVASLADPLKAEVVPDRVIGNGGENAQLASQLKLGSKNVTLGDIQKFISTGNKALRRANYYSLDPSAQVSSGLADTASAVAQARDVFYKFLQDRTGVDIQPLRQTEASLIRLQDNASATANEIAQQSAQFRGQSRLKRAATTAKAVASVGTLGNIPVDPMTEFQGRMGKVFGDVQPGTPAAVQMPAGPLPKPTRPPNDLGFSPDNGQSPTGGPDVDLRPRAGKSKFNPYRMSPPSTPPAVDDIMQAAKEGKLSPGEADRRLKQLGVNIRVQKRGQ